METNSTNNVGKASKVSYKNKVLAAAPDAILVHDRRDGTFVKCELSDMANYAVGTFIVPHDFPMKHGRFEVPYAVLSAGYNFHYYGGWSTSSQLAWKNAWIRISKTIMEKLEGK